MSEPFVCGTHRAFIYGRGGMQIVGEVTPLRSVQWNRVRDDVSSAQVTVPVDGCPALLNEIRTVVMELHIERNGEPVWEGPITRIEIEWDVVRIYAEDVLWVAKRTVLREGYNQEYPNIGDVVDRMDWLLRDQTFVPYGDPWNVVPHLHKLTHPAGPRTTRTVNAYEFYVWEDLDKYAEDYGADYCVVNRDVFYFDIHYAWAVLPPLEERFLSQFPRLVEYGYELATRSYVTNGAGQAGIADVGAPWTDQDIYGYIDLLVNNNQEGTATREPTAGDIAQWTQTATNNLSGRTPAPVSIVIPANTTLLPGAPWRVEDLVPGAWFEVSITRLTRSLTQWQRISQVVVSEEAPRGETVQFTAGSAPGDRVDPP